MYAIRVFVSLVLGVFANCLPASAYEIDVRGRFVPNATDPADNAFKFDNYQGLICGAGWTQGYCASERIYEFRLWESDFPGGQPLPAGASFNYGVDGRTRSVSLVEVATGEAITVSFKIAALNTYSLISPKATELIPGAADNEEAYQTIWGRPRLLRPPCTKIRDHGLQNQLGGTLELMTMEIPDAFVQCGGPTSVDINNFMLSVGSSQDSIAVRVLAPQPLSLRPGTYEGSTTYRSGPGGELDVGFLYEDFKFNLSLTVTHAFDIRFPGGSNLLSLAPEGGWMAWLQRGRKPTRLFRDQNFDISTSTPFKMKVICQFPIGNTCGIDNGKGHQVPVDIRASLPVGIRDPSHQPVHRYPLIRADSPEFKPDGYVHNGRGTLHFEVLKNDMETMLGRAGSRYAGDVTVVWDSNI
jgi:hypothetical protein